MKCKGPFVVHNIFNNGEQSCCCNPGARDRTTDNTAKSIEEVQTYMISGNLPEYCDKCQMFKEYESFNVEDGLYELSFSISSACNSICRSCRDELSMDINKESIKNQLKLFTDIYNKNKHSIKKVVLMGGETTFFHEEVEEILRDVVVLHNIKNLTIFVNGSNPDEKFFSMLSKYNIYDNINILISIDGTDVTNNIIRHGCHFDDIRRTANICRSLRLNTKTTSVVSVLNIFHLNDLIKTLKSLNIYTNNKEEHMYFLNPLTNPEFYSLACIDVDHLKEILSDIESNKDTLYTKDVYYESTVECIKSYIDSNIGYTEEIKLTLIGKLFEFDEKHNSDYTKLKIKF